MTPERIAEIARFMRRYGCGNCWTGTVGQACTYIFELLQMHHMEDCAEVQTSGTRPAPVPNRKQQPIARGVLDYFPDAISAVAHVSYVGNEQHNAGEPMHWAREKSSDHADCIVRHLISRGKLDTDGLRHTAKVAWRALALLQLELEGQTDALRSDSGVSTLVREPVHPPAPTWSELMEEARKCDVAT